LGALQIFKEAGMMSVLRKRSLALTGTLETLLMQSQFFVPLEKVAERYPPIPEGQTGIRTPGFTIITPRDPESRGAQLSLIFFPTGRGVMEKIYNTLTSCGVIGDKREPDVFRLAPIPLYNSLDDCHRAASCIEEAFDILVAA
jgi:kynureninase